MLDISNKLHALVDEFVSNLSSECDTLANNVSSQACKYVAPGPLAEPAPTPRQSNRTTSEVLNGLRRPSEPHLMNNRHQEENTQMEPVKPNFTDRAPRSRSDGRFERPVRNVEPSRTSLEGDANQSHARSLDINSSYTPSNDPAKHGRTIPGMAAIDKFLGSIEILSSDQSSDDCLRARLKHSKPKHPKAPPPKTRGRPTVRDKRSPSMSRESSHTMNYSYEEETTSIGGRRHAIENPSTQLIWPQDERDVHGGTLKKSGGNGVVSHKAKEKDSTRQQGAGEISQNEGDESNEEDVEGNPIDAESDEEEMPVLPKVPVKRKSLNDTKGCERRTQRGRPKSASPQMKKQRTPQIDASVITQLDFDRRPQNCVRIIFAVITI